MLPWDYGPLPVGMGTYLNFSIFLEIKTGCLGAITVFVLYEKKSKWDSAPLHSREELTELISCRSIGPAQMT